MPVKYAIAVHGGVGNTPANLDGCIKAAEAGLARLAAGGDALSAAVDAAVLLENDGRFNAGRGSSLRMDGVTVEMDASVQDTRGKLGAVAALQRVQNPVLVARAIADSPHWLIVGEGAQRFARTLGLPDFYEVTARAKATHDRVMAAMAAGDDPEILAEWRAYDFAGHWNFPTPWTDAIKAYGSSTIGAVALDTEGHFAVCNSTGGSSPMLYGRVGDTPIPGCGYHCGPAGAIAATGIGEFIVREALARQVYGWLEAGMPLQAALDKGVALFPLSIDIGLIGVTQDVAASSDNRQMPAVMRAVDA